jgi:hypothetical protein
MARWEADLGSAFLALRAGNPDLYIRLDGAAFVADLAANLFADGTPCVFEYVSPLSKTNLALH